MNSTSRVSPGRWRTEQVWIGRGNSPLALAQIAVAHAQFETIHPFTDGNNRTGRALVQSMLRNKGLTRQVTVPVSAGLLSDTDGYFAALTAYREGDLAPIVEAFAHASERAIVSTAAG